MNSLRVLDLFSGIGGFSLGLERAGMKTAAFCEINPFCQSVLRRHWPDVPIYNDVREFSSQHLTGDRIGPIDLICGGFPCQDISDAGKREGLTGSRSSLWWEYRRLIDEIRPAWAIIENVLALRYRGLGAVLGSLHEIGYDAEWHCIPACAVGAPHRRDRIWIIAYPAGSRLHAPALGGLYQKAAGAGSRDGEPWRLSNSQLAGAVADTGLRPLVVPDVSERWRSEPEVCRVVDGVSGRLLADEIMALGNTVSPAIPEIIGHEIAKLHLSAKAA